MPIVGAPKVNATASGSNLTPNKWHELPLSIGGYNHGGWTIQNGRLIPPGEAVYHGTMNVEWEDNDNGKRWARLRVSRAAGGASVTATDKRKAADSSDQPPSRDYHALDNDQFNVLVRHTSSQNLDVTISVDIHTTP